jgi:hypothetical protein
MIPPVIPTLLLLASLAMLATGWWLLRRLGPRVRVGRLLAAIPIVSVGDARRLAETGASRYVGVMGRIDAEDMFEDELHRPLVYRRSRLEARSGRGWSSLDSHRQLVPFEIVEGVDRIAVDSDALDEGLVVVVREAEGTAGEVPDRVPRELAADTPIRLRVEQVTGVEHAYALGVPSLDSERGPILRPGLGRPLVLTTLEREEAMRVLAVDHRSTTRLSATLLAGGLVALTLALAWWVIDAVG